MITDKQLHLRSNQQGIARVAILLASALLTCDLHSQIPTSPVEGLRDNSPKIHALVNATIITAPGRILENANLVLEDGLIRAVGKDSEPPPNARIWNLEGKWIYPGFLESYSHLGLPQDLRPPKKKKAKEVAKKAPPPKPVRPTRGTKSWNANVTPEREISAFIDIDPKEIESLRNLGFATAISAPGRGVFQGQSTLLHLNGKSANLSILIPQVGQHIAFEARTTKEASYPNSLMGCIALIRQTLHDANWHREVSDLYGNQPRGIERAETNAALVALAAAVNGEQRVYFKTEDELDYLRSKRIADEFELDYALIGSGYEYRITPLLREMNVTVIVSLKFPDPPPVETPESHLEVSLEQLQHWEMAPSNLAFLAREEIPFCLTTRGLEKPEESFWKNLRECIRRGLDKEAALAALTTEPARLFGVDERLGTIEKGKIANLVVGSGDLFADRQSDILAVWVDGVRYETKKGGLIDPRGEWSLTWTGVSGVDRWKITGDEKKLTVMVGDDEFPAKVQFGQVIAFPNAGLFGLEEGTVRLAAYLDKDRMKGSGRLPDGATFSWTALRVERAPTESKRDTPETDVPELAFSVYPAGAYGRSQQPVQPTAILVKNATIWTSGSSGILESADLFIEEGIITAVGKRLKGSRNAHKVDASGKHITPGLIDCHSHTAISRGVNEGSHAVTLEVRIGDVLNPTDIALYRELGGGLTTANILHGSANPMGGQNQVIKLRWGEHSEGLKFRDAKPGVKFALGENVKQSNWGDNYTTRYPQTRMGVEQLMRDTFMAALEYERLWQDFHAGKEKLPPRRNLRLETALEILNNERIVHIHSYRQDEILMFARLAEEFEFTIGTYQHVLEGYKIAEAIARVGAGASTFSDWWAYKFEVYDAIPFNGALLHQNGIVTSFNSDSNEMARRLNTEAAKAVKYGGLSELEALKFVTLNPAIQLRIDHRVGSLEPGKDADFVIWSGHLLSVYSRAEQTWIDGRKYFDFEEDRKMQNWVRRERERLVAKALPYRLKKIGVEEKSNSHDTDAEDAEPANPNSPYFSGAAFPGRSIYGDGHNSGPATCGVHYAETNQ